MRGSRLFLAALVGFLPLALVPGAKAAPLCSDGGFAGSGAYSVSLLVGLGSTGCQIGDKIYSDFSFTNLTSGVFGFTKSGIDHTFSGSSLNFTDTTNPFTYSYKVAITGSVPGQEFTKFSTGANGTNTTTALSFTKNLVATTTSPATSTTATAGGGVVNFPAGTVGPVTFASTLNLSGGKIDTISDSLSQKFAEPTEVPSPLPLFGAAAAFGFSRKLRGRIKHAG